MAGRRTEEPLFRRGETLEERYAGDPALLALYKKKLPKPGWAGVRDACEKEYIRRAKQATRVAGRKTSDTRLLATNYCLFRPAWARARATLGGMR